MEGKGAQCQSNEGGGWHLSGVEQMNFELAHEHAHDLARVERGPTQGRLSPASFLASSSRVSPVHEWRELFGSCGSS